MTASAPIPSSDPTERQPRAYGDELHGRGCPIAHGAGDEVVIVGHAEALAAATDAEAFSSAVSRFLQIPNGLDGEEHAAFRRLLDRYLALEVVDGYADEFLAAARSTITELVTDETVTVDAVAQLGATYAVRSMLAWLGWPVSMEQRLIDWVIANNEATRSGELERTAAVAEEFDAIIRDALAESPADSVTRRLVRDESLGRPLESAEVISILRNWTGGDLSSMAYCIGVILAALVEIPALQDRLREWEYVSDAEFVAIMDEILRRDSPFVSNRRITTGPVSVGGAELPAGQSVRIHWTAANRDPRRFGEPDAYDPEANAAQNLVWGAGPHACPGKDLSMLELRAFIDELLAVVTVTAADTAAGERETHPVGGWASLPVTLTRR
ncbi:cytochrome P450 [Corynebacterium guangdongense]|uniref:Cytochrome P450 n=1 Tax=Corynebacterium guangdongense TaxID=1783348 RepID=A0ABU1ZZ69_9CORY|nr:cytochrome P450 [Corynebacterium guangdongense]MDR7330216.1 cytochrome P450 [Corynebacterium guangdongense]WJZ18774.1 Erythromycin C-12 hydroxylase [Corynebacterium guangdongense]